MKRAQDTQDTQDFSVAPSAQATLPQDFSVDPSWPEVAEGFDPTEEDVLAYVRLTNAVAG